MSLRVPNKAILFATVSVATTVVDFGLFNLLVWTGQMPLLVANTISYGAGIIASYLLNKSLTFAGGGRDKIHHEIGLFVLINVAGLWLNNLAVVYAAHLAGGSAIALNAAKLAAGAGTWAAKFFLFQRWVYPQPAAAEDETVP